ncbi:phosphatidylinositol transfer protein csr1 [Coemansia sp. IMI 209128]|nr:phosphatidylinositol transfer protein csr1 [Coemansia sp. RSA 2530]KAJ2702206.1 phosphatidylinositol transfer protein csr1 [Coemansia sp. IMI 209128]
MASEEASLSLLDHYARRLPLTEGRLPSLSGDQLAKLRRLWRLLLSEFDTASALPVLFSLAHAPAAGAASDVDDLAALSFEPLVSLGSKADKDNSPTPPRAAAAATPTKDSPVSGGWLSWMPGSRSSPSATPAANTGTSTPAPSGDGPEVARLQSETVQEYINRSNAAGADLDTLAAPLVPPNFKPLFGQPDLSRSFSAAFWQAATQMRDPDSWVLRFLRARKWDVDQAFDMIRKTLAWRVGQAIDEVAYFGESKLHYHTMRTGLAFACTTDRLGCPVYVVRVRVNVANNRNILAIKRFLCWQLETSQLLAANSDGRVTILFDLSDVTRENIDLGLVRMLITLLSNYFPETLGIMILFVNSWFFWGLWTVIAPFIDPVVKSKIVMVRATREITSYIDLDQLPSELGGKKPFHYSYIHPTSEENACMADAVARQAAECEYVAATSDYERATRQWLAQPEDTNGADLSSARCASRDRLHQAVVALDPFVRSRTLHHRLGQLKPDYTVLL